MIDHDTANATRLGDIMRDQGEHLIDHLYDRVIRAFGVLFLGVLLIVLASRLFVAYLKRRAERRTFAGGNVR